MVSNETVKEFQAAIEAEYGVALAEKEAQEILLNWVGYFDLLSKIDHRTTEMVEVVSESSK
jgi:hypothetical protein